MCANINYSFVIPHKNCPDLLQRCVDSIPERDDVQVIVVDDNSEEGKKPSLKERRNLQVVLLDATQSNGAGKARNVGMEYAQGKWLIFADSDDFFVDELSEILDSYVDNIHDIIYFNIKMCDCYDTSKIFKGKNKDKIFNKYRKTGLDVYLRVCYTEPWGKIIRRQIVTDNRILFQETKAHNDLLFSVSTGLLAGKVEIADRQLYWYVSREGSIRNSVKTESFDKVCDRVLAWNSTQSFLYEHGIGTSMHLAVRPCIRYVRHNIFLYIKLLKFMRKRGINYICVLLDTIRFLIMRIYTSEEKLGYAEMLSYDTLIAWHGKHEKSIGKVSRGG